MCRCGERRTAIVAGLSALSQGDIAKAAAEAGKVARTSVEDLATAARFDTLRQAAHARLRRR